MAQVACQWKRANFDPLKTVLYTFFGNSHTGQTPQRILTRDGSKDAFSRKDICLLGVKNVEINSEPISAPKGHIFAKKLDFSAENHALHWRRSPYKRL